MVHITGAQLSETAAHIGHKPQTRVRCVPPWRLCAWVVAGRHSSSTPRLLQECKHGDLDLGEGGDGRWALQWKTIRCPSRAKRVESQGSHQFYAKLKFTGGPSGIRKVVCDGRQMSATPDGFWVTQDGSGKLCNGLTCNISYTDGSSGNQFVSGSVVC